MHQTGIAYMFVHLVILGKTQITSHKLTLWWNHDRAK